MKFKIHTKLIIIISSLVSILLVSFIAINANRYLTRMSENNTELYSAFRISELMKSFKNNINILENKQRGYIVTGDAKFLEAYRLKETETKTYLQSMEKYFSGKPEEALFYKLKELTYKKLMEVKDIAQDENTFKIERPGMNTMADINNTVDEINASLSKTTKILIDNSIAYVQVSKNWSFLEIAIGVLTALAAVIILFRDVDVRNLLASELKLAKKQADDNVMMKEQFMANMSHEIRTPMNAILGFTNLLQKTHLDPSQAKYLQAIKTSSSNLLNIINDILDFSKIEAGELSMEKISFNVKDLLHSLKLMFAGKATSKQINLELLIAGNTPTYIFGDPTRLNQILVNLVNNAIKFTDKGAVKILCEVKSIEHDTVSLVFRVKDSGIGIEQDKLSSVFDRFKQGNTQTTRLYGGTGLGLSIVKSLVEIQNGDIVVKSKPGIGSEFIVTISFPVSYPNIENHTEDIPVDFTSLADKKFSVLLAEDNTLNQTLASHYLTGFGLQTDIAANGKIAVDMLKAKHYDLVLMDIQMPMLDGYSASKIIREELHLTIPVIAMTAHIMKEEQARCISYGMNDYISKPFKEAELYAIIKKHLIDHEKSDGLQEAQITNNDKVQETHSHHVVNLDELKMLTKGRPSFLKEMITIFLKQVPKDISDIENAVKISDFQTIQASAHKMRTSVGFIGMKHLLVHLIKMEDLASAEENMPEIVTAFYKVKNDCTLAIKELNAILTDIQNQAQTT